MERWSWLLARIARRLWFRASLYGLAGILTALMALLADPFIPEEVTRNVGTEAVGAILSIMASSMLAVTTFSLGIMVSATSAAAGSATPRAANLLMEDAAAQSALSTFLGAFLFSLVGLIGLNADIYGDGGQLVLFIATLSMIGLVVITLLRWINQLTRLGRLGEVIDRVEAVAARTMANYAADPLYGCNVDRGLQAPARAVPALAVGHVQHIDLAALAAIAEEHRVHIHVAARTGAFCVPGRPVAHIVSPEVEDALAQRVARCFTVGDSRSFDQDPRFGLVVLTEIASRALSPAVNDPGTAIDVVGTLVRVLRTVAKIEPAEVTRPRLHVPLITPEDMFDDAFGPIARDGAAMVEVAIKLQKALRALASIGDEDFAAAANRLAEESMERALAALPFQGDRRRLRAERIYAEP
ncbi:DUF2254 domain-containing protein [Zavarzinia compransoris]|uniref:DUF2254 domain-containing protein n=1 Tax=Zavarzinia marina TaxID=2911065 RepID=UPI001F358A45|nr:DUF2254 domain-containing protein [Zavarzinia marina]MCF4167028.1 DUF2254 domain-containing protein [Zavarzinia marina]